MVQDISSICVQHCNQQTSTLLNEYQTCENYIDGATDNMHTQMFWRSENQVAYEIKYGKDCCNLKLCR